MWTQLHLEQQRKLFNCISLPWIFHSIFHSNLEIVCTESKIWLPLPFAKLIFPCASIVKCLIPINVLFFWQCLEKKSLLVFSSSRLSYCVHAQRGRALCFIVYLSFKITWLIFPEFGQSFYMWWQLIFAYVALGWCSKSSDCVYRFEHILKYSVMSFTLHVHLCCWRVYQTTWAVAWNCGQFVCHSSQNKCYWFLPHPPLLIYNVAISFRSYRSNSDYIRY